MSKLANKKPVLDVDSVDARKFVAEAYTLPKKAKAVSQTFRFDDKTTDLLNELATLLTAGNKTLVIKASLAAFASMPASEQREAVLKLL
ncbi:TPA: hypothetical protein U5D50_004257 [Yersinia enterocolitica]|nr:hypothetical protein [Yersinia enterocolitica]